MKKIFLLLLVFVSVSNISKSEKIYQNFFDTNTCSAHTTFLKRYIISGTLTTSIQGCTVTIGVQISFNWNGQPDGKITDLSVTLTGISINCPGSGIEPIPARIAAYSFDQVQERVENVVLESMDTEGSRDYIITDPQLAHEVEDFATGLIAGVKESQ